MGNFYLDLYDKVSLYLNKMDVDLELFKDDPDFIREFYRITLYRKFWESYRNDMIHIDPRMKNPKDVKINLAKAFVDRSADFLVGKPFTVYAPDAYSKLMAPVIAYINKKSGIELFALEVVTNGSVCGDSFVKVIWDEDIKSPRFQLLDSEKTFVKYRKSERNRTVLQQAVIVWEGQYTWPDGTVRDVLFKEVWTEENRQLFVEYLSDDESEDSSWKPEKLFKQLFKFKTVESISADNIEQEMVEEDVNDLGFIPIVHFRNQVVPMETYGRSDLVDIVDLNLNLNEAASQYLDSVKYHGSPITLIFGAKIGNLRRGPNKIWSGFPKDAKVDQLGGQQNFPAVKDLMEQLQDFAYLTSGIPEASSGLFQNISNATGIALQVQYLPLIGLTRRKRLSYEAGFVQIYEYALKMLDSNLNLDLQGRVDRYVSIRDQLEEIRITEEVEVAESTDTQEDDLMAQEDDMVYKLYQELSFNPYYKVEIKWAEYLPRDSMQELQELQMEMEMGIESKKGAMRRRGIKDIDAKFKEIEEDKMFEVEAAGEFTADNMREMIGEGFAAEEGSGVLQGEELPEELPADEEDEKAASKSIDLEMEEYRAYKASEQGEAGLVQGVPTKQTPPIAQKRTFSPPGK